MKYTEHDQMAFDFLRDAGTTIIIQRDTIVDRFPGDTCRTGWRWKYQVCLQRGFRRYIFPFYDSVRNYQTGKKPTAYDILSYIERFPVPDTIEDFASQYGLVCNNVARYKLIERIWKDCRDQYQRLRDLFGDRLMAELQEIF